MEHTRSSLTQKLEVLEKRVSDTVEEATSAVSDTIETVKDTVESTVETVKGTVESTVETVYDAFNLSARVERHPWAMVSGSLALGFVSGLLLSPTSRRQTGIDASVSPPGAEELDAAPAWAPPPAPRAEAYRQPEAQHPSWWNQLLSAFGSEIDKLKGLAIGTAGAVVRDLVAEIAPENLKPTLTDMINNITTKVGGQTIPGRVLPESHSHDESHATHASYS